MKNLVSTFFLALFSVISLASPVRASLIADEILDPGTGLNWLPIVLTEGMTVNQVLAATQSGGEFSGFQLASTSQLQGLFQDMLGTSNGTSSYAQGNSFFELFGYDLGSLNTFAPGPGAAYVSAPYDAGLSDLSRPLGPRAIIGAAQVALTFYVNPSGGSVTGSTGVSMGQGTVDPVWDNPDPEVSGGWLVQSSPAPEPSALLLFGSGLFGLAGYSIRKKLGGWMSASRPSD
jgi:hypothetical protein